MDKVMNHYLGKPINLITPLKGEMIPIKINPTESTLIIGSMNKLPIPTRL